MSKESELKVLYKCMVTKDAIYRNYLLSDDIPPEAIVCDIPGHASYGDHIAEMVRIVNNNDSLDTNLSENGTTKIKH